MPAAATEIYSCVDANGRKIFTDNREVCKSEGNSAQEDLEAINLDITNVHSQYGASVSEEYRNYPFRAYEALSGYSINIIAEKKLLETEPDLLTAAAKKLERAVKHALSNMPAHISNQFSDVKYYLFSGDKSRTGGRKGGQWYFRRGNPTSARFDDSIVVRSAKDYIKYEEELAAQVALHELSHAYYHYHRKKLYWKTKDAYDNARKNKLYLNVKHKKGWTIKKAYAISNDREYFAELSKIFHLSNAYYPFSKKDLKEYDPLGYQLIKEAYLYSW